MYSLTSSMTVSDRPSVVSSSKEMNGDAANFSVVGKKPKVVFVLGGPGSGKGTQCAKIVENYGFVHLSAGDLLRAEINSGSENGTMIQNMIKEGKIVPAEVTVGLLQKAMSESKVHKFLIDGFPRNEENRVIFERITKIDPEFILFFHCTEQEMEKRLLSRNQGRVDDNIDTIQKRFKVFVDSSLPVIEYYEIRGKVRKVDAARPIDEVFDSIKPLFMPFVQDDLLTQSENLLHAIDNGDYTTYKRLCDTEVTSFVPEAQGHLVQGLDFQRFYFDLVLETKKLAVAGPSVQSIISSPTVSVLSDDVGLVTYTRLQQKLGSPSEGMVVAYNETRLWKRVKSTEGEWEWKNVHLHQSKTPSS